MSEDRPITRRDFLRLAGAAGLGGAMLACGRTPALTPAPPAATPRAMATLAPVSEATVAAPSSGAAADTVLINGRVLTVDAANSVAEALAIQGDKILGAGSSEAMRALAGASARVVDLRGRTVTPGFIDPHIHFRVWGLQNLYYVPFLPPEVKDIAGLQRALAAALEGKKPGEWLMGFYLALAEQTIPTREDLDPVSRNNPVFIMHSGGHWGTANSAAMKLAGITAATPSPEGGIIEKKNGELTGVFYNHRAMDLLRRFAPPITIDQVRQAILDTQKVFAACGVTSLHDNNIREVEHIQLYRDMARQGELHLRSNLYLTLEWPSDLERVDQVQPFDDSLARFAGYKFLIDGQGPTAYCHEPHNGVEWRMPTWDPKMFKDTILSLHDRGLQICVHCIGDAAADLTLEAYEAAMNANPRRDPRHRIEHAVVTTPQATQKMKDLGVIVSTQPAFIYLFGEGWKRNFTPAQMRRIVVTREWLDAGVHVAIGSDAPSTPLYYPQATIAGAMTRVTYKNTPIGADQVFDFTQALRAHTYEGAFAAHQEQQLGSLEPGKLADLVVWPTDPTRMKMGDLAQLQTVDATLVGGKVVHGAL